MPNEILNINSFETGTVTNADVTDIPLGACKSSKNIDTDAPAGELRPIKGVGTVVSDTKPGVRDLIYIVDGTSYIPVWWNGKNVMIKEANILALNSLIRTKNVADIASMSLVNQNVIVGRGPGTNPLVIGKGPATWFGASNMIGIESDDPNNVKTLHITSKLSTVTSAITDPDGTGQTLSYNFDYLGKRILTITSTDDTEHFVYRWYDDNTGDPYYSAEGTFTDRYALINDGNIEHNVFILGNTGVLGSIAEGVTYYIQFGQYFQTENGITSYSVTASTPARGGTGTGSFSKDYVYNYSISFTYDGNQESPLKTLCNINSLVSPFSDNWTSTTFNLKFKPFWFDRRITNINIYRNEQTIATPEVVSYSRQICSIPVTTKVNNTSGDCRWTWSTGSRDIFIAITDYFANGASYEMATELPETTTKVDLLYGLNIISGGYNFATNANSDLYNEETNYMFRSKAYRYSIFDQLNDVMTLPEKVTVLTSCNNRLFAWGKDKLFRIEPNSMVVENTLFNAGCIGQNMLLNTNYGIFFGNEQSYYYFDGNTPVSISDAIKFDYQAIASTIIKALYSPKRNMIILLYQTGTAPNIIYKAWVYHIAKKCWTNWELSTGNTYILNGGYTDNTGEVYIGISSSVYEPIAEWELFGGTNYLPWEWVSGEIGLDDLQQDKKFQKILMDYSGTITVSYALDGGTSYTTCNLDTLLLLKGKTISIKLASSSGTSIPAIVSSLGIMFRRFIGKR